MHRQPQAYVMRDEAVRMEGYLVRLHVHSCMVHLYDPSVGARLGEATLCGRKAEGCVFTAFRRYGMDGTLPCPVCLSEFRRVRRCIGQTSISASSVPLKEGDRVVVTAPDSEYLSRGGIVTRWVDPPAANDRSSVFVEISGVSYPMRFSRRELQLIIEP